MGLSVLATAVVLATSLTPHTAHALALGRLTVQSALSEPLRAEIEVPDISDTEAATLRVGLASTEVYRAAGVDLNALLANTTVRLQRRPDGRAFLSVVNPRPINEPYLDLILEVSWATGRIVRDFTMLFDPPSLRRNTLSAPLPASAPASASNSAPASSTQSITPVSPTPTLAPVPLPAAARTTPPAATKPAAARAGKPTAAAPLPAPPAAEPAKPASKAASLTVKQGDTAGRIANARKPANATLEQMLVAMLRANPQAFINGNINQIKAGAIIDLPDSNEANATTAAEAHQIVATQSRDFNAFRQRLAAAAPAMAPVAPGRKASGSVQAEVTDQRSAAQAPDQLKLTKGSVASASTAAAEEKIAKTRQAQETAARTAELTRNIEALAKVDAAGAQPAPAAGQPAEAPKTTVPGVAVTASVATTATPPTLQTPPAESAQAAAAPAAEATSASAAASPATPATTAQAAPAPTATAAPPTAAPPPPAEPGFLDDLTDNPLVVPAAGGLIAILLGMVAYRLRKPKKNNSIDSSYLESRLQPDSFFGASGGQNVDTAEAPVTGSSLMYSASQLDASGDVDPVAEADVYLAYGRDLQAEEILKEAMRLNPTRVAVHSKMLEIYAKRRDLKSFDVLASEIYTLTQGSGPVWEHARELGTSLFPDNPFYQPGGAPDGLLKDLADHAALGGEDASPTVPNTAMDDASREGEHADTDNHAGALDLDLDLDFSIDTPDEPQVPATADVPLSAAMLPDLAAPPEDQGLTFDLSAFDAFPPPSVKNSPAPAAATPPPATDADDFGLTFDLSDLGDMSADPLAEFKAQMAANSAAPNPKSTPEPDDFSLHFELPELSGNDKAPAPAPAPVPAPSAPPSLQPVTVAQAPQSMPDMDMMAFDLNGPDTLGDFDGMSDGDPLETKLSLATEFLAIGDEDGARSLAEEVLEQATGSLKAKASTFLSNLG